VTARLLVVDDEPRTAELTAELLRRAGYIVDVAGSGTEALERVRASSPDLMLLDYEMPDMEAPEVLDLLRSGADRLDFPVIILTGARHAAGDQVLGIERGATDYILNITLRLVDGLIVNADRMLANLESGRLASDPMALGWMCELHLMLPHLPDDQRVRISTARRAVRARWN